jgi:hypothetical protein
MTTGSSATAKTARQKSKIARRATQLGSFPLLVCKPNSYFSLAGSHRSVFFFNGSLVCAHSRSVSLLLGAPTKACSENFRVPSRRSVADRFGFLLLFKTCFPASTSLPLLTIPSSEWHLWERIRHAVEPCSKWRCSHHSACGIRLTFLAFCGSD